LKVDYSEESSVRKALTFEVEPEIVDQEIEARAREYARKAKIPGFRAGKIPAAVIKQRFKSQVMEETAEAIVNRVVFKEIEDRGLKPLANPKVTELRIDEHQPMTFKVIFETLPAIELPEYKGLSVDAPEVSITTEDVDKEIEGLREQAARFDAVEGRPSREGDFVVLDLKWSPEKGEGGHEENAMLEVGSAENHPDLNAALLGLTPGAEKTVKVAYEPSYPVEALAGQTVEYAFTVKSIKDKVVPTVDDEFAKDLDFDSLLALRGNIRERLEKQAQQRADRALKGALVQQIVEKATFEVPETLVERHMSARTEHAARSLLMQGIDPRTANVDWNKYREGQREQSALAAKADILLDEIARKEAVEVTDAEVDAEIARTAERLRRPVEQVRARMEKEGEIEAVRAQLREEKVLELLKAGARMGTR
jgi:trigger factor